MILFNSIEQKFFVLSRCDEYSLVGEEGGIAYRFFGIEGGKNVEGCPALEGNASDITDICGEVGLMFACDITSHYIWRLEGWFDVKNEAIEEGINT